MKKFTFKITYHCKVDEVEAIQTVIRTYEAESATQAQDLLIMLWQGEFISFERVKTGFIQRLQNWLKSITFTDIAVNTTLWAMPVLVIAYRVFFTLYNR